MSNLLDRALSRCDYGDACFEFEDIDQDRATADVMAQAGLLVEAEPLTELWCRECGDELAQLRVIAFRGKETLYMLCAHCGPMPIAEEHTRRWRFHVPRLAEILREQLSLTGSLRELAKGRVWQLGRRVWHGKPRLCYFAWGLFRKDAPDVFESIQVQTPSLWFIPDSNPRRPRVPLALVVSLTDVMSIDGGQLTIDLEAISGQIPATVERTKPQPPRRSRRAAAIEAIRENLVEYLRSARDHALAAREHGKPVTILPRPSQKDLAKLTGLTEVAVSRCLRDPAATELRLLWETAADPDAVLGR